MESTNSTALDVAGAGVFVVADHQSAGRGRLDRRWEVPRGASVAASAVVPLPKVTSLWGWVPLFAGLATLRAVRSLAPSIDASVKWPNDVIVDAASGQPRKLAGLLCQVVPAAASPLVVVGVGINVTQTRDQLPIETATSLALERADVSRDAMLIALGEQLADVSRAWNEPVAVRALQDELRLVCSTIGTDIDVHEPGGAIVSTRAIGLDEQGRLVTQVPGRAPVTYAVGDVIHVRRS